MNRTLHRVGAWVLTLVYLCTLPAVLPLAFALAARIEGSHGVALGLCGDESRVVLTHEASGKKLPHDAIHQHCLFAKVLASLAKPADGDGPDHVVKFASLSSAFDERRIVPLETPVMASDCAPDLTVVGKIKLPRTHEVVSRSRRFPAEHAPPDFFLGLKSTVLLI